MTTLSRAARRALIPALGAVALLGATTHPAAAVSATLTLNPNHAVVSATMTPIVATFQLDTCFPNTIAKLFWDNDGIVPIAFQSNPPCNGTGMQVVFGNVIPPGVPGDHLVQAGLWANATAINGIYGAGAAATFHIDPQPPPPLVSPPAQPPPARIGPPAGPPPPTAAAAPPPTPQASPSAAPCPPPAVSFIPTGQGREGPGSRFALLLLGGLPLTGLLFGSPLLLRRRDLVRLITLLAVAGLLLAATSCGRVPPDLNPAAATPSSVSQAQPTPSC